VVVLVLRNLNRLHHTHHGFVEVSKSEPETGEVESRLMHLDGPAHKLNGSCVCVRFRLLLPHVIVKVLVKVGDGLVVVLGHRVAQRCQQVSEVGVAVTALVLDRGVD